MDAEPRPAEAAWSEWIYRHSAEILADPLLHSLASLSRAALGERAVQIARLTSELDRYQGRTVQHCTEANAAAAGAVAARDCEPGTVLRATDTGREWVLTEGRDWLPR